MKDWIDSIQSRTKTQAKYDKEHTKGIYLKLNLSTDTDILRWLWKQPSKQGAIKNCYGKRLTANLWTCPGVRALSGGPWNNGAGPRYSAKAS